MSNLATNSSSPHGLSKGGENFSRAANESFPTESNFVELVELLPEDIETLRIGQELEDTHIAYFHTLLKKQYGMFVQNCSNDSLKSIKPVPINQKVLQLIHLPGHWVCCHYENRSMFIYDSMNKKNMSIDLARILSKLFPAFNLRLYVKFPDIQKQPPGVDCGVFAIANAITCLFNENPKDVLYDCSRMRDHLMEIFDNNEIRPFPKTKNARSGLPGIFLSSSSNFQKPMLFSNKMTMPNRLQSSNVSMDSVQVNSTRQQFPDTAKSKEDDCLILPENNTNQRVNRRVKKKLVTWQGMSKLPLLDLTTEDALVISRGEWLKDNHMSVFISILQNKSLYLPYQTLFVQYGGKHIKPVPRNLNHIQILPGHNHWTCSFYNATTKQLFVYDSMNRKMIDEQQKIFLEKLFPTYNLKNIIFPKVQSQINLNDCGVFAIAFAVSLVLNLKPESVNYEYHSLRPHLLKLLQNHLIEHFPRVTYSHKAVTFSDKNDNRSDRTVNEGSQEMNSENSSQSSYIHAFQRVKCVYTGSEDLDSEDSTQIPLINSTSLERKRRYFDAFHEVECNQVELSPIPAKMSCYEKGKIYSKRYREKKKALNESVESNVKHQKRQMKYRNARRELLSQKKKAYIAEKKIQGMTQSSNSQLSLKLSQKIVTKYKMQANSKFKKNSEKFVSKLVQKMKAPSTASSRLEAENVVKWCLASRKLDVCLLERILKNCKENAAIVVEQVKQLTSIDRQSKLEALCGSSKHNSSTEAFFAETAYKHGEQLAVEQLVINRNGCITNILPVVEETKKGKSWACDDFRCKIDAVVMEKYQDFLNSLSEWTVDNVHDRVEKAHKCEAQHSNISKLGHPRSCYVDCTSCQSTFLSTLILSPHFPNVRKIQRFIYEILRLTKKISALDKNLEEGNVEELRKLRDDMKENQTTYEHEDNEINLNEDEIQNSYKKAFTKLKKNTLDIPIHACVCCESLESVRDMTEIANMRKPIDTAIWAAVMKDAEEKNRPSTYVCTYCVTQMRKDVVPPTCILNNLQVDEIPPEISVLNDTERILIQRAKAFQTIERKGTVGKKNLPPKQRIQKVIGRTFHLPLSMEETLKRICPETEPINKNHEYYILVRSLPGAKTKTIWENKVNIGKVYAALQKLKSVNPEYKNIILPVEANDLLNKLQPLVYEVGDDEKIDAHADNAVDSQHEAMNEDKQDDENDTNLMKEKIPFLTQKSKSDDFYEPFTIYPLNGKRMNETALNLYQMKKILEAPMSHTEKKLDILCFPDLFHTGKHGMHDADRGLRLTDAQFIKSKLRSKHPQFRLNSQYLFFLLNDCTNRQINQGIYSALNVPNCNEKLTAGNFLTMLKEQELNNFMNTIFGHIRNTAQYWKKPRNNLMCMVDHYGPATFFLTLSPAEWLWGDLIEYIRKVNSPVLDKTPEAELIARDPVSVSRFMDNKFHAMLEFICSEQAPLGKVVHYFWRREYQGRGTQHYHTLLWIDNAPILGESTPEEVSEFILKHITCRIPDKKISPTLYERVTTHQKHTHNSYCLRSKTNKTGNFYKVCRFGFARPETDNLITRDVVTSVAGRKTLKKNSRFYDLPRTKQEGNINDYNPIILTAWEGNMDIQYIGEKTRVATNYVTKYETKAGEKSHLVDALNGIDSNKSLNRRLWTVMLRSLSHRECGALEAADTLLGISLYGTDPNTTIRWININEIRSKKLKTRKEIEQLDENSEEIFCPNFVDNYYPNRPTELKNLCLYDFAKWYDVVNYKLKDGDAECYQIGNNRYVRKRKREYLINHYKYNVETHPEKYFHSLLLLFQPWKNASELKNGCETYAESYHQVASELENVQMYHEKLEEIKKAKNEAEELIKQQIEINNKDDLENDNKSVDGDLDQVHAAMDEFKQIDEQLPEEDVADYESEMNVDQKRIFDRVTKALQGSPIDAPILRLYVSGEGGTGKSFLINAIRCWVKQVLGKRVAVTAPTGIAAFSINGLTIHRMFSLPVEHGNVPKYRSLSDTVLEKLRRDLEDVEIIIIDEISMVSNVQFMYIHKRLSEIYNSEEIQDGWFGKKHILLFGDLLQLAPVKGQPPFKSLSSDDIQTLIGCVGNTNLWTNIFEYDELTINMRQKGDTTYRDILKRIRVGYTTKEDRKILETKKIPFNSSTVEGKLNELCNYVSNLPAEAICIFPTRRMCNILNTEMLKRIDGNEIELHAHDSIDCKSYLRKKVDKALQLDDEDMSRSGGLPRSISIKIGAKIMITKNIDISLGLVNGSIGIIKSVSHDISDNIESVTIILASSKKECIIERYPLKFEIMDKAYVIRKQFPMYLSYAITIHKSQGLSLKQAVIDAGNRMFADGQIYVAFSRVTTLEGLHIANFDPSWVRASGEAIEEYNRLRKKYRFDLPEFELHKNTETRLIDDMWFHFDQPVRVQESERNDVTSNISINVRGLTNNDGVSCYANAVLQCIFHCQPMKSQLMKLPTDHVLQKALLAYSSKNKQVNVREIRCLAGEQYVVNDQQDVQEFITHLFNVVPALRQIVEFRVKDLKTCNKCNISTSQDVTCTIVILPVSIAEKETVNLQQLFDEVYNKRAKLDAKCTVECGGEHKFQRMNVESTPVILVVQLMIYRRSSFGILVKIKKCSIKGIPTAVIKFGGSSYRVISAIFHTNSEEISRGHYFCFLRQSKGWAKVNDNVVEKKSWPYNAKEMYVLFLQRQ